MDVASFWVSLIAAGAALAGAVFTYVQARAATQSREDAQAAQREASSARDAAVAAQQESALAAGRIAEVLESRAAEAREAADRRPSPWEIRPGRYRKNGDAVVLTLTGAFPVADVAIDIERAPTIVHMDPEPVPTEMQPGDAVEIYYMRAAGDPSTSTVVISWRWADRDEVHQTRGAMT